MSGAVALLGSGEYLAVMQETDRLLLHCAAAGRQPRVALIPAASGLEPGSPQRWNRLGREHFEGLGAAVLDLPLVSREDGSDPAILEQLEQADLVYFSGGNPGYLHQVMAGSPAWEVIQRRRAQGASVAGCSAGAMVLGSLLGGLRSVTQGQPAFGPALGVVPGVLVLPHYDRFRPRVEALGAGLPGHWTTVPGGPDVVLGIDENTALVWDRHQWGVLGVGQVWICRDETVERYRRGQAVPLPPPASPLPRG